MYTKEVKWLLVKKPASLRTANLREEQTNIKNIAWWNKEGYKKAIKAKAGAYQKKCKGQ